MRPHNIKMEPTRLAVCAIMSLNRAAHFARYADYSLNQQRER